MGAGIAPECWSTPNSAAVNMGPRYSSDGAVQYGLSQHPSKVVFVQSNVPGTGYIAAGPAALAEGRRRADHRADRERADQRRQLGRARPRQQGRLERLGGAQLHPARGAGDPPGRPEARPRGPGQGMGLLDAVQHRLPGQGAGTEVEPQAVRQRRADLGRRPQRAGDAALQGDPQPSTARASPAASARSARWASCWGSSRPTRSQTVKGAYTIKSVNAAFKAIKDEKTELLCQPWVYGHYPLHIPNNADFTTTPENGKMVTAQGCFNISAADPQIAQYRKAAGTAPSHESAYLLRSRATISDQGV